VLNRGRVAIIAACAAILLLPAGANTAPDARADQPTGAEQAIGAEHVGPTATAGRIPPGAGLALLRELEHAWHITKGGGVLVAVLSTGVAPVGGLSGKVIKGPNYAPVPNPVLIDGTVLASLIAASGPTSTNPTRTVGGAPAARILSERIVAYGSGAAARKYQEAGRWQSIEAKAIRYAVNHGARVIVVFESGGGPTTGLTTAVAYAVAKKAVIITGGSYPGKRGYYYPDDLPGVINVSGVTLAGAPPPRTRLHFATDESILISAPANVVVGTGPSGEPRYAWGNYSTLAWTAATVALIKSVYPRIPVALVDRALASSARYHPAGGYNTRIGFGLINPIGALRAVRSLLKLRPTAQIGPGVKNPDAYLGAGRVTGVINAVRHNPAELAGFSAVMIGGLMLLVLAFRLARRSRRQPATEVPALRSP